VGPVAVYSFRSVESSGRYFFADFSSRAESSYRNTNGFRIKRLISRTGPGRAELLEKQKRPFIHWTCVDFGPEFQHESESSSTVPFEKILEKMIRKVDLPEQSTETFRPHKQKTDNGSLLILSNAPRNSCFGKFCPVSRRSTNDRDLAGNTTHARLEPRQMELRFSHRARHRVHTTAALAKMLTQGTIRRARNSHINRACGVL
jgi:hypothetical protein